jgi:hypothetical protein
LWGTGNTVSFSQSIFTADAANNGGNHEYEAVVTVQATSHQNRCVGNQATTTLKVLQKPVMNDPYPNPLAVCSGSSNPVYSLSTFNNANATYTWTIFDESLWEAPKSGSNASGIDAFKVKPNETNAIKKTTIEIFATHADNGCVSDKKELELVVRPLPVINGMPAHITVCPGEWVVLPALTTNIYGNDASMI